MNLIFNNLFSKISQHAEVSHAIHERGLAHIDQTNINELLHSTNALLDAKRDAQIAWRDANAFAFELGQNVSLIGNFDEQGQVIARAQYTNGCNQYWVRYRNGNNVSVEVWWAEDALIATE